MTTPTTVFDWLQQHYPQSSRTTLRQMVASHRISRNGHPVLSLKEPIEPGDEMRVMEAHAEPVALPFGLCLIHQDNDILVVHKPAGLLTSTHLDETRPTAVRVLNQWLERRAGEALLIHRLDKDASGVLVFARNHAAFDSLKDQFMDHSIERQYVVQVEGLVEQRQGHLVNLLQEMPDAHVQVVVHGGKEARMKYQTLHRLPTGSTLLCELETGRKHQIRVQLAHIGHPVVGDSLYGGRSGKRLMLHAARLGFIHPKTGRPVQFFAAPPVAFPGFSTKVLRTS